MGTDDKLRSIFRDLSDQNLVEMVDNQHKPTLCRGSVCTKRIYRGALLLTDGTYAIMN